MNGVKTSLFKLVFFVPESHCESVKTAIFEAGAGRQGNYADCSWQVLGEGQFRPLDQSQPFIGEEGKLEKVMEYRVETLCESHRLADVIAALKNAHPYEDPAYDILRLEVC